MDEIEYKFEYVPGVRKNSELIYVLYEKELYVKKTAYNGTKIRCICYNKMCKASIIIDAEKNLILAKNVALHPHPSGEENMNRIKFINAVKQACKKSESPLKRKRTAKEIYEQNRQNENDNTNSVPFKQIKRTISRFKSNSLPKVPKSPVEIKKILEEDNIKNNFIHSKFDSTKNFYQYTIINQNIAYTIFMAPKIAEIIQNFNITDRNYLMDGTFKVVPQCGYTQLLIIYIAHANHVSKNNVLTYTL